MRKPLVTVWPDESDSQNLALAKPLLEPAHLELAFSFWTPPPSRIAFHAASSQGRVQMQTPTVIGANYQTLQLTLVRVTPEEAFFKGEGSRLFAMPNEGLIFVNRNVPLAFLPVEDTATITAYMANKAWQTFVVIAPHVSLPANIKTPVTYDLRETARAWQGVPTQLPVPPAVTAALDKRCKNPEYEIVKESVTVDAARAKSVERFLRVRNTL